MGHNVGLFAPNNIDWFIYLLSDNFVIINQCWRQTFPTKGEMLPATGWQASTPRQGEAN